MEHKQYGAMEYGTPIKTFGGIAVYDDLDSPSPDWLVEDLIIERGHHVIYAATEHKKSFLAMDLGLRLVNGMDYHGRRTTPCEVLYVVGEDTPEFIKRQAAWLKHYGKSRKMKSIPYPVQFKGGERDDFEDLIDAADYFNAGLVIFDNLADVTVGIKLIDNDDYNEHVKPRRKELTKRTGAATLFLHHTGKSKGSSELGAVTIRNDANMLARVGKPNEERTTLTTEKLRGAKKRKPMRFRSIPVGKTIVLETAPSQTSGEVDGKSGESKATDTTTATRSKTDQIIDAVRELGAAAPLDVANHTGIDRKIAKSTLSKLGRRGTLGKRNGKYVLPAA